MPTDHNPVVIGTRVGVTRPQSAFPHGLDFGGDYVFYPAKSCQVIFQLLDPSFGTEEPRFDGFQVGSMSRFTVTTVPNKHRRRLARLLQAPSKAIELIIGIRKRGMYTGIRISRA